MYYMHVRISQLYSSIYDIYVGMCINDGRTNTQKRSQPAIAMLPVQIFLSPLVVFLLFLSRFALIRQQIDSNTMGWLRKIWTGTLCRGGSFSTNFLPDYRDKAIASRKDYGWERYATRMKLCLEWAVRLEPVQIFFQQSSCTE